MNSGKPVPYKLLKQGPDCESEGAGNGQECKKLGEELRAARIPLDQIDQLWNKDLDDDRRQAEGHQTFCGQTTDNFLDHDITKDVGLLKECLE